MSIFYGSSGDIRNDLGNPTETEISASLIDLARKKATSIVDAMLEVVYPSKVPWTVAGDVPMLINSVTDDLAIYYIRRSKHPGPLPLTKEVKQEYWEQPIDLLKRIQKREIDLPELTSSLDSQIEANRVDYTPIFDLDEIESAVIDPDLLDDIDEKRD